MKLDPLTDVVWRYELLHGVEASDGADGQVFGQGTAEFTGRLAGTATWANFPRLREGYAFPNAHGRLAHYKIPRYVLVVEEFPMTVTGKIRKVQMRDRKSVV